jgi:hypothetical protein
LIEVGNGFVVMAFRIPGVAASAVGLGIFGIEPYGLVAVSDGFGRTDNYRLLLACR